MYVCVYIHTPNAYVCVHMYNLICIPSPPHPSHAFTHPAHRQQKGHLLWEWAEGASPKHFGAVAGVHSSSSSVDGAALVVLGEASWSEFE